MEWPWARVGELLAGAAPARSLIHRLDPATRAKVLAALAALIILGFAMMFLAWLGARVTRRYMNRGVREAGRGRRSVPQEDDWAARPLVPRSAEEPREDREHTA